MKAEELRQKEVSELLKLLTDSREKLRKLSFDLASRKLKNVREIGKLKKDIARILTILRITNQYESTNKKLKTKINK